MPTDALGLMPFKANWNMGVVEDSTCRLGPFDAMGRLAGLTYTVYIIHLVRIWLLGIWDQANWVPWPFSSFCLNHLISRKSLILSLHGYFFHVILVCDFFHLSLCIMNTLFWNFIYNSLFLLPIMSDQDAIGTVSLGMSSPYLRESTHFWPGCHCND